MNLTKLLCLGDSLTEGYDIDKSKRWSTLLSRELNLEVINCGISGDTTAGMLSRFYNNVIPNTPSHLLIMGGTNDLWLHLSLEQIIANIHAMTRQAKYHGIETIIGVPTPVFPPNGFPLNTTFLDDGQLAKAMEDFQDKLRAYAKEDGKTVVDFSVGISEGLMLADGVHPNEAGQVVMMRQAAEVLKEIIVL